MALKIVKANDPVKVSRLNICIYAGPGYGKTSMGFTADEPLLLDADHGVHRAANRKDSVPITSWAEIQEMTEADLAPYKTVVVDTVGRVLDYMTADIIKGNAKMGQGDGSLTLKGYGALKQKFSNWLKMLNTFGKDVVLIAHMDEQRSGDEIVERLDVQGGSKAEIYKSVDAMGRIFIRGKERVIDFSPRENAFGKNPCGLEIIAFPDPAKEPQFLAKLIAHMKDKLNEAAEAQLKEQQAIEEWRTALQDMSGVDDINKLLPELKGKSIGIRAVVANRAKELGFTFDPKAKAYVAPAPVQQVESQPMFQ